MSNNASKYKLMHNEAEKCYEMPVEGFIDLLSILKPRMKFT